MATRGYGSPEAARLREIRGLGGAVTRGTLNSGALVASHSPLLAPAKARVRTSDCAYTYTGFSVLRILATMRGVNSRTHTAEETHTHAKRAVERGERLKERR